MTVGETATEIYVPRKRIKSFQSTDSLDKWRENDVIPEEMETDVTGILYRLLRDNFIMFYVDINCVSFHIWEVTG